MFDISFLRLLGIFWGLAAIFIAFLRFRLHSEKRGIVWISLFFGMTLAIIGIFPNVVDFPAQLLLLREQKGGRLLTILILSNVCLWFLYIYERSKTEKIMTQFDSLVRNLSLSSFNQNSIKYFSDSIVILIPAFNEEKNLIKILPLIPDAIQGIPTNIIVIDDGSDDHTLDAAKQAGATVIRLVVNRGGGAALKAGYGIVKKCHPKVVVTMDADGQHNPSDIENLVIPIIQDSTDFVIGSRILGSFEKYSPLRIAGVRIFSRLINIIMGTNITDCSSGFRAMRGVVIQECVLLQEQYHTPELIIEVAKRGFGIMEQPVKISGRLSGVSKKGNNLKYAALFFRTILKTWLR